MRNFITIILILIAGQCAAVETSDNAKKIAMIGTLKTFLKKDIKLNINNDLYTKWDQSNIQNYLLYISKKGTIQEVTSGPFIFFGTEEAKAKSAKKYYDSLGYETLLYNTNNAISTNLSNSLLAMPSESIVFIVVHEAVHNHYKNKNIPYIIEEAACDLIANYASLAFFEKHYSDEFSKAKKQKKLNEKLAKRINESQKLAEVALFKHKEAIYKETDKKIKNLIKRGNDLHKERFNYEVNNAFYVRYQNYSKYYFSLKQTMLSMNNYDLFLKYVEDQSNKKPKFIDKL